jgi:PAS domain-containing protein
MDLCLDREGSMKNQKAQGGDGLWSNGNLTRNGGEWPLFHLLEHLPAGAYTCDPGGLITNFNQAAVQFWGRTPRTNYPVDRFCGSFKLYAADGAPADHS